MKACKPAFDSQCNWNKNIVQVVLLNHAVSALGNFTKTSESESEADLETTIDKIIEVMLSKPNGDATVFRWTVWLFRTLLSSIPSSVSHPEEADNRAYVLWKIIHRFIDQKSALDWLNFKPADLKTSNILCALAVKNLISSHNDGARDNYEDLLDLFPTSFDDVFKDGGSNIRELFSVYSSFVTRPDNFSNRILALCLKKDEEGSDRFNELWFRTLPLREAVEFKGTAIGQNEQERHEVRRNASMATKVFLMIGMGYIDLIGLKKNNSFSEEIQKTFGLYFDMIREMSSIDPISKDYWLFKKFLVHRWVVFCDRGILRKDQYPQITDLLDHQLGVTYSYFEFLSFLLANGMSIDLVESTLKKVGYNFQQMVSDFSQIVEFDTKISNFDMSPFFPILDGEGKKL